MTNAIYLQEYVDVQKIPQELRDAAIASFKLGFRMACEKSLFVSPFEDENLTEFWKRGFRHHVFLEGMAAPLTSTILDCPYKIRVLVMDWCNGMRAAEMERKPPKKISRKREICWYKDGF